MYTLWTYVHIEPMHTLWTYVHTEPKYILWTYMHTEPIYNLKKGEIARSQRLLQFTLDMKRKSS